MRCPVCQSSTSVIDTRDAPHSGVRRRRECVSCKHRYSTYENEVGVGDSLNIGEVRRRMSELKAELQRIADLLKC